MFVCLCYGVSGTTIRRVIEAGARSFAEIGRACKAGTDCGGCRPAIEELLAQARAGDEARDAAE